MRTLRTLLISNIILLAGFPVCLFSQENRPLSIRDFVGIVPPELVLMHELAGHAIPLGMTGLDMLNAIEIEMEIAKEVGKQHIQDMVPLLQDRLHSSSNHTVNMWINKR